MPKASPIQGIPLKSQKNKISWFIITLVIIIISLTIFWFTFPNGESEIESAVSPTIVPVVLPSDQPTGIGSEISDKIKNPLRGSLPDTGSSTGALNPLGGAYRNPFE